MHPRESLGSSLLRDARPILGRPSLFLAGSSLPAPSSVSAHANANSPDVVRGGGLRWLARLNFFLADVQTGLGPFLAASLAASGWNPERVGLAMTLGGAITVAVQTPAGALVDGGGFGGVRGSGDAEGGGFSKGALPKMGLFQYGSGGGTGG